MLFFFLWKFRFWLIILFLLLELVGLDEEVLRCSTGPCLRGSYLLATAPLQNLGYTCVCPFQLFSDKVSDHAPLVVKIGMKLTRRRCTRAPQLNKWVTRSKPFCDLVFLACAAYIPSNDPYKDIEFYKLTFQEAAFAAARTLREASRTSASAQASALASSARALHRNDWASLRLSFRSLPSLKPLFAQRGPEIFITNVEGYAA